MKTCVSTHKLVEVVDSFTRSHSILTRDLCKTWIAAKSVSHLLNDVQQQTDITVLQNIKKKLQRTTVLKLKLAQKSMRPDDTQIKNLGCICMK